MLPTKVQLSQDNLTGWFRSRLHALASSIFPNPLGILPLEFNTGNSGSGNALSGRLEQTQTLSCGQVNTRFSSDKTQLTVSEMNQGIQQMAYQFHA